MLHIKIIFLEILNMPTGDYTIDYSWDITRLSIALHPLGVHKDLEKVYFCFQQAQKLAKENVM